MPLHDLVDRAAQDRGHRVDERRSSNVRSSGVATYLERVARTLGAEFSAGRLSELIESALDGESIVITRHGRPVVELRAIPEPPQRLSPADLDWLAARRVGRVACSVDAGALVRGMRDDDEAR